ncbi:MAG: HAD-IB family phosphatase [Candidatus Bipolaricaulota bacterium]|nr:HAD-IB family phosphatase [Candidatus Bipolaricaulota bacterium]
MGRVRRRGISTIVFDLDGTLVRYHGIEFESSWGAVAAAAGVGAKSRALLADYFSRPEAYAEWVARDAALLAGVSVADVAARVLPAPYADGVVGAVKTLRGHYRMGILSSGVDLVADWVCEDLELDFALANRIHVLDGRFTGTAETVVDLWAKDRALRVLASERGFHLDEICFVGDHVNDVPAMRIVGLAVAANPKDPAVGEAAWRTIRDFAELPAVLEDWRRQAS